MTAANDARGRLCGPPDGLRGVAGVLTAARDLFPPAEPPEPPPMSAKEALRRVDVMIACMDMWAVKRGETAQLMGGWAAWLRAARPHLAEAADRSNAP